MNYNWDFSIIWQARSTLLHGLLVSFELTAFCIFVGTLLAIPLSVVLARRGVAAKIATPFVEAVRALPILVLLIWFYYVVPNLFHLSLSAFWTAAWVLAINLAAFAADILRGAIEAIPTEHIEAAEALGMTRRLIVKRIVIPEMFRRSVPSLTAMYITMFKFSTLASVISVWELLHASDSVIINTYHPLEVYTAVAVIYLVVVIPAALGARSLERNPAFAIAPSDSQ